MKEPFDPPGAEWRRVSPALRTVRLIGLGSVVAVVALIAVVIAIWASLRVGTLVCAVALLAGGWGASVVNRQIRSLGYDVGADALTIRRGVMFQELVVVPYARIQYVDVQAGPLLRRFGLAALQLHTASASTDAAIPGLRADDASDLRDQLARLGETRSVGL